MRGNCPLNNCNNKTKKCTNCNGSHTSTAKQCDKLKQHINRRYQQNTRHTYAQVLNRQQPKLDITQQQQKQQQQQQQLDATQQQQHDHITKLTELHETLRNTISQIKQTQEEQNFKINCLTTSFNHSFSRSSN